MTFLADLHVHSRYSLATSKELSPRNLDAWARLKGIDVLGTGDFTHPSWRALLRDELVFDEESGLYTLGVERELLPYLPLESASFALKKPLFCLQCEISSIYRKNGRVRKIHNLIFVPTLDDADRLSKRLEAIGNLASDGRPILGLDAHDLLEILLETVPGGYLIPAHIWTPWFSLFGSRSGFDSIEECFEDLSSHIFALETGLSSDPPMNRYISALDRFTLVSNSDAHSANKLGREANVFAGTPSYQGIFSALKAAARRDPNQESLPCRFMGTIEFFPEEGKYHLDGHRACNVSLNPLETRESNGICPVCHKPLTVGVLHRVMELADRKSAAQLLYEPTFSSVMPLLEMTAEIMGFGTGSNKVLQEYGRILSHLGSELDVLCTLPLTDISSYWPELGEACTRLREGRVKLQAGYDGAFGRVHLFSENELGHTRRTGRARATLAASKEALNDLERFKDAAKKPEEKVVSAPLYTQEQRAALEHRGGPALVLAGPGAGKTHLLIGRIRFLLDQGVPASAILAITFTRRAAEELFGRLAALYPPNTALPLCTTLHAYAWRIVQEERPDAVLLDDFGASRLFSKANSDLTKAQARDMRSAVDLLRERCTLSENAELAARYARYAEKKADSSAPTFDFLDLIEYAARRENAQYAALLVDEIQDCSLANLRFIRSLLPPDGAGFFGIGDPDQSIYGFRGSVRDIVGTLTGFWPGLVRYALQESFRSREAILNAAEHVLGGASCGNLVARSKGKALLEYSDVPDAQSEAQRIAKQVATLLGTSSHTVLQGKKKDADYAGDFAPGDIAILVRFRFLIPPIEKALASCGVPSCASRDPGFWQDPVIEHLLALLHPLPGETEPSFVPWTLASAPEPRALLPWIEQQAWATPGVGDTQPFKELCALWKSCGGWEAFFEELSSRIEDESLREKSEQVRIMTMHASKGLEFRAVFLPAFEEGLFPVTEQARALLGLKTVDRDEERRLCYVAMTRASELLFVSRAARRQCFGKECAFPPSSFLQEQWFQKKTVRHERRIVYKDGSLL